MNKMILAAFFSAALVWQLHSAPENAEPYAGIGYRFRGDGFSGARDD